ncbi:MAG: PRC-barrel domain-containing protein [Armatimonadetes bacterium]|nr:PRC-barrel domain-containing protein [Armatimonadota bacterium]
MVETDARATLVKLSGTTLTLTDPAEDVRGRKVVDQAGEEVGEVDDLLIDDREHKVRFLQVSSGGFLGLGATQFLIPVDAVTRVTEEAVHIDQARERLTGAPRYKPDVVDTRYAGEVYGYYGYPPFWGPGYLYPAYPYYP